MREELGKVDRVPKKLSFFEDTRIEDSGLIELIMYGRTLHQSINPSIQLLFPFVFVLLFSTLKSKPFLLLLAPYHLGQVVFYLVV